jgi:alkylation response protein AidB-like acyl-CoA dehydrogenase
MFNFITEEHRLIADSVRKVFEDLAAADTVQRQTAKTRIDGATVCLALADLGVFGTAPEDQAMASAQVQSAISREAGAACLPYPVLEALAAHAVMMRSPQASDPSQHAAWVTVSLAEAVGEAACTLTAARVTGKVRLVPFATMAQVLLVPARRASGEVLACAPLAEAGVTHAPRVTVEADYPVHDVTFEQTAVSLVLDVLADGKPAVEALQQRSSLLAAAEISGVCRRLVHMTRDYLVARTQFGAPLGSNQALKHALADALVKVEAMNAIVDYAAAASDADSGDAGASICAAKMFAGSSGKQIADTMLQLHGAIGYTMEYPLQLLMRRAYRLNVAHGPQRVQGERLYKAFVA